MAQEQKNYANPRGSGDAVIFSPPPSDFRSLFGHCIGGRRAGYEGQALPLKTVSGPQCLCMCSITFIDGSMYVMEQGRDDRFPEQSHLLHYRPRSLGLPILFRSHNLPCRSVEPERPGTEGSDGSYRCQIKRAGMSSALVPMITS